MDAEHVRVPDLRLALSIWTRKLRSSLLTLAVTAPAVALVAAGIGIAGATSVGAAAQPASVASAAHVVGTSAAVGASSGAGTAIVLDSFSKPLDSGAKAHRHLTPHGIARSMLRDFGWSKRQFKFLDWLWNRESSWNVRASNPYSGAYGIPQAVPGSKMASAGSNWRTSARTQIRWGLDYIHGRYGSPLGAWRHEKSAGWY